MSATREEIEALRGKPLPEADALLGAPLREDRVSNGSSGSFEMSRRCYFEHPAGCFVIETTSYLKYAYGTHHPAPERAVFSVKQVTWFPSRADMATAMATWRTDFRSDND